MGIVKPNNLPVVIRKATEHDVPFIFNSWLKSFRDSSLVAAVSNTVYFSNQHKLIQKLVKTSEVLISCNPDDPDQLYGYIVCERIDNVFVIHYVYIKTSFRGLGLAKALLAATDYNGKELAAHSHSTKAAQFIGRRYNFIYHPYVLFDLKTEEEKS